MEQQDRTAREAAKLAAIVAGCYRQRRHLAYKLGNKWELRDCRAFVADMIDKINDETLDMVADILYLTPNVRAERTR